ncbi:MAG: hypothetical protein GY816_04000, partial [Cytophagales bacterium]|nr:hypothetical protein [Cytophagales bacterium]
MKVYSDCDSTLIDTNDEFVGTFQSRLSLDLTTNESIYNLWDDDDSNLGFDRSLTEVDFADGDNCGLAEVVTLGVHTTPYTDYWYEFTPTVPDYYVISSLGLATTDTYLKVYSDCGLTLIDSNDDYAGTVQSSLSLNLKASETIYILWDDNYSSLGFDWSLSKGILEGENCKFAHGVTSSGDQTLPETSIGYYWYRYTMKSTAKLEVSSATSNDVELYYNTCDNLTSGGSGTGSAAGIDFEAGDDVFIGWYANGGGFNWSLIEVDFEKGDKCELADVVTSGDHTLPVTPLDYYWYKYTMTSTAKLVVTSTTSNYVTIQYNTCNSLLWGGSGAGSVTGIDFEAGDDVFIYWYANGGGFNWSLTEVDFEEGDKCELAEVVTSGNHTRPVTSLDEYWYKYTMTSTARLEVISATSNYVELYANTCDNLSSAGSGFGSVAGDFEAGDDVFIRWEANGGFNWSLIEDDNCDHAKVVTSGNHTFPVTSLNYYWYRYTMKSTAKLEVSSATSNDVELYYNTCDNLTSGGSG